MSRFNSCGQKSIETNQSSSGTTYNRDSYYVMAQDEGRNVRPELSTVQAEGCALAN
uniref:Uncharacterized protein n=1 Tax=Utricularia reniformis TaxID=192314 RepID=A0A1Y0B0P5_9LAMI|nr:hypothetical protein AEK19_MT0701 [Utricularia reniformis]ART30948.1 hypothetical protein AEK19_MT0701 [Utricularia reniformis]